MNQKEVLSWLGCSSSLTLSLLVTGTANAETQPMREIVFAAPNAVTEIAVTDSSEDCLCSSNVGDSPLGSSIDLVGDRAIARYGCDCAGCRNLATQVMFNTDLRGLELNK